MTADREIEYWESNHEWYVVDYDMNCYHLTDRAPERVQNSFKLFQKEWPSMYKDNPKYVEIRRKNCKDRGISTEILPACAEVIRCPLPVTINGTKSSNHAYSIST